MFCIVALRLLEEVSKRGVPVSSCILRHFFQFGWCKCCTRREGISLFVRLWRLRRGENGLRELFLKLRKVLSIIFTRESVRKQGARCSKSGIRVSARHQSKDLGQGHEECELFTLLRSVTANRKVVRTTYWERRKLQLIAACASKPIVARYSLAL